MTPPTLQAKAPSVGDGGHIGGHYESEEGTAPALYYGANRYGSEN